MKTLKKCLSILLSLVLVVSMLSCATFSASAADEEQETAIISSLDISEILKGIMEKFSGTPEFLLSIFEQAKGLFDTYVNIDVIQVEFMKVLDKLNLVPHLLDRCEEKAATCSEEGWDTFYKCRYCGACFKDANGKESLISIEAVRRPINSAAHSSAVYIPAVKSNCIEGGHIGYYYCEACGKCLSDPNSAVGIEIVLDPIDSNGHNFNEGVVTTYSTYNRAGTIVYTCTLCGKKVSKSMEKLICSHDNMKTIAAKNPTATKKGNIKYFYCPDCGCYFRDSLGKKQIGLADTVLAKTKNAKEKQFVKVTAIRFAPLTRKYTVAQLAKSNKKFNIVARANTKLSFKKISGSKYLSVNGRTGKVTVKKGLSKGRYYIRVRITAKASAKYKKAKRTKIIKVIVR